MRPELFAVALAAAGALAFEVLLPRLLAVVHRHHLAGVVISLALLGYGATAASSPRSPLSGGRGHTLPWPSRAPRRCPASPPSPP